MQHKKEWTHLNNQRLKHPDPPSGRHQYRQWAPTLTFLFRTSVDVKKITPQTIQQSVTFEQQEEATMRCPFIFRKTWNVTESDELYICTLSIRIFVFLKASTYSAFPLRGTVRVGRGRYAIPDQMMQYHQKSCSHQFKQDQWNTRMRCNLEGKFCPLVTLKNKIQSINSDLPSTYLLVMMSDFAIYNKSFMQQWTVLFLQILWPFNESTKTFMSFQPLPVHGGERYSIW